MQGESTARSEQMVMKEWEVYRLGTTGRSVEKNKRGISRKKQKEGRAAAEEGTKRKKRRGEERRKGR